jgi:hypothetical protein
MQTTFPETRELALGAVPAPEPPRPADAVEALIHDLRCSRSATTRWWAAWDLGNIIPAAPEAVPALVASLQDRCPCVRLAAAEALGAIGQAALPAVPALTESLNHARLLAAEIEGALQRIPAPHVAAPFSPVSERSDPMNVTTTTPARKGFAAQMREFFGLLPGQRFQEFGAELKALTAEDKQELAALLTAVGYPCEVPAAA